MVVYQGKNEQGVALAAVGYAKQMRRKTIFACTSSVGPGACNMVTAAATATANNIPVLILPGDIYASRQPDPVLQQMEQPQNLSISAHDAFQAVTKYWGRINRPEQVMTDMISAMRVLTDTANTGAVAISLPQDVQAGSDTITRLTSSRSAYGALTAVRLPSTLWTRLLRSSRTQRSRS